MTAWAVLTALVGAGELGALGFWWYLARRERARALEVYERNARIDKLVAALRARDEELARSDAAEAEVAARTPAGAVGFLRSAFSGEPEPLPPTAVASPAEPRPR